MQKAGRERWQEKAKERERERGESEAPKDPV
jgi:hypothetical protein